MTKTRKKQVRVYLDLNKWEEISHRIPAVDLSNLIDKMMEHLLNKLIEKGTHLDATLDESVEHLVEEL